jgi:hypothetical protein
MEIQPFGFGLDLMRNTSFCFVGSNQGNLAYPKNLTRSREDHGEKGKNRDLRPQSGDFAPE